jgi:hypothetical protein
MSAFDVRNTMYLLRLKRKLEEYKKQRDNNNEGGQKQEQEQPATKTTEIRKTKLNYWRRMRALSACR